HHPLPSPLFAFFLCLLFASPYVVILFLFSGVSPEQFISSSLAIADLFSIGISSLPEQCSGLTSETNIDWCSLRFELLY
ncbi:hypothetical protein M8C21_014116, partial [Ambrosia artemisiifolia]